MPRYAVRHLNGTVYFDINHEVAENEEIMPLVNEFWSGAEGRVKMLGSTFNAALSLIAREVLAIQFRTQAPVESVRDEFLPNAPGGGVEGFPALDGSFGITLVAIDGIDLELDHFSVEKVEEGNQ